MSHRFLALALWLGTWFAVGIAASAVYAAIRGRGTALTVPVAAVALLAAAVLANAGADLW